jgi:hypothetical protein
MDEICSLLRDFLLSLVISFQLFVVFKVFIPGIYLERAKNTPEENCENSTWIYFRMVKN